MTTSTTQEYLQHPNVPVEHETALSQEDTLLFKKALDRLDENALLENPFGRCSYSMQACHGIAKALVMLFPNGRGETEKPPTTSKIEAVRRFLKVKVKRHTQINALFFSPLPTVEELLEPGLFSVDERVPTRLRIRGKEVITPCLLIRVIFGALADNNPKKVTFVPTQDSDGQFRQRVSTLDIPKIAAYLMEHCIIPGGAWTIYGSISNGNKMKSNNFERLQSKLF